MKLLIHWVVSALAIIVAAYLVPGVTIGSFIGALILAVVLGALNLTLRPILLALTLPINILTLGLFSIVVNAIVILIAARIVPQFGVSGFWTAVIYAIVLAVINWVFSLWAD